MNQIVTFVIDKELDIKNHFIALRVYKRNIESGFPQNTDEKMEKLMKLTSQEEIRSEIEKQIEQYYKKENKLISIADDINREWAKIEKDFISELEKIHKFPFSKEPIKGVLSTANRFGYHTGEGWFATKMFANKFSCIDTTTHELMHFIFHKYYDRVCIERGLSKEQMWNVKESFTELLNNPEFNNIRFLPDYGYTPHKEIREVIRKSWNQEHDFNKALEKAIEFVLSVRPTKNYLG